MVDAISESLQTQLDEVHALHYIFFPATVLCKAGITDDLFSEDLMPYDEYNKLLALLTVRTKITLYAVSSSEQCEGLLKIGFRASPGSGDYSNRPNMPQCFIEVTFPENYPDTPPSLVILMNMSLSNATQKQLMSRMETAIRGTKEGGCVYNAVMCLNEFLNDVHAKRYKLWDETTGETVEVDHGEVSVEHSASITKTNSTEPADINNLSRQLLSFHTKKDMASNLPLDYFIGFGHSEPKFLTSLSYASSGNEVSGMESDVYSPRFDLSQWSVHCVIQSPLWYESNRRAAGHKSIDGPGGERTQSGSHISAGETFWTSHKLSHQIVPYDMTSSSQVATSQATDSPNESTDKNTDRTSSDSSVLPRSGSELSLIRRDREVAYPLDNEKVWALTRSISILESLAASKVIERYHQDFKETTKLSSTTYSSFVKAQHMLDKNLYIIRKCSLPAFCVLKTKETNFIAKESISSFIMERKRLMQKVFSRVALLAKLQHNSITRYYECWVDKLYHNDIAYKLIKRAEALLKGKTLGEANSNDTGRSSLKYRSQCLLLKSWRDEEGVNELLLNEAVVNRQLYIQMEHCEGVSLEYVIQREELYKNETLIWTFTRHLLDVLAYLHNNKAYHQALSLKNIVVYTDTSVTGLKVCQFGITGILRQLCHSDFFCCNSQCSCNCYCSEMREELYSCHPSTFGVGPSVDFSDMQEMQQESDYDSQQEDMFAFGMLIFRMWHPPMEERAFKETITSIISKQKFPQYFLQSTPPIIVSTLIRLLSPERRPTAMELLSETLVPPVMDRDLYKQYLRRLQNPASEEAMDALDFLFKRGWQGDVTRLRSHIAVDDLSFISSVVDRLEAFMRQRSVITAPPVALQPNTQDAENEDFVLALNEANTVLHLTKRILRTMQKSYSFSVKNQHNLSLRRFCVGEVFDANICRLSAVYSNSHRLEEHIIASGITKGLKQARSKQELLTSVEMRIIAMEAETVCTAVESLQSLNFTDPISLALQYPPLVIDFIALLFHVSVKTAHRIYTSIGSVDINQYTLNNLLHEMELAEDVKETILQRVVGLLRGKCHLSYALYEMHSMVIGTTFTDDDHISVLAMTMTEEIAQINGKEPIMFSETEKPASDPLLEHYLKKMKHMLELTKLLSALGHEDTCFMDCIPGSKTDELCEGSIDFPSFSCYVGSNRHEVLVLVGGNLLDDAKVLHVYCEYLIHNMTELKNSVVYGGDQVDKESLSAGIDVVVTCQSTKLLPAACSISSRLIDSGLSCECRALPLIHTDHFNERLKQFCAVKVRVHLQTRAGNNLEHNGHATLPANNNSESVPDDDNCVTKDPDACISDLRQLQIRGSNKSDSSNQNRRADRNTVSIELETPLDVESNTKKSVVTNMLEYDDEYIFSNVSFHVEPMRGAFKQPRKIDNGVALVRYVKSLITSEP